MIDSAIYTLPATSMTKRLVDTLPKNIHETALKVAKFVDQNFTLIEATALFYGLFFVTSPVACSIGCATALGILGLALGSKYLPKWTGDYIRPLTHMETVDKALLMATAASISLVIGNALLFEIGLGIAVGSKLHSAINSRIIQPIFG